MHTDYIFNLNNLIYAEENGSVNQLLSQKEHNINKKVEWKWGEKDIWKKPTKFQEKSKARMKEKYTTTQWN